MAASSENINPADLVTHPQGELEVAMAPQPDAQSLELGDMFNDFDFGTEFATDAGNRVWYLESFRHCRSARHLVP